MSIKTIKADLTTSTLVKGVCHYNNPAVSVTITQAGEVYNKKTKNKYAKNTTGLYPVYYTSGSKNSNPTSFESLFNAMLGMNKGKWDKFSLKDPNLGWTKENVNVDKYVPKTKIDPKVYNSIAQRPNIIKRPSGPTINIPVQQYIEEVTKEVEYKGFILLRADHAESYTTEDMMRFDNLEEAEAHQSLIDSAKPAAELVIADKAGWVLAERIFLLTVKYKDDKKPYEHFKSVIANSHGITKVKGGAHYKFSDKNQNLGDFKSLVIDKEFVWEKVATIISTIKLINEKTTEVLDLLAE